MGCRNSKVVDVNVPAKPVMVAWEDRKCRDVFWLLLFVAYWVGMVMVAMTGFSYGDVSRLLFAMDAHGNQCGGVDSECLAGKECGKFITYPRVDKDYIQAAHNGITNPLEIPFFGLCVSSCPEGLEDTDADGKTHDWVCDYSVMDELNAQYDAANAGNDVPSDAGRAVLDGCLAKKQEISAPFAELFLSDATALDGITGDVKCQTYMSNCYKLYVAERNLFFRCVPTTEVNETCTASPYLEAAGESVFTKTTVSDGVATTVTRPATREESCGTCIEPELDVDGGVMDPASSSCKAVRITSSSSKLEATPNPIFEQVNSWTSLLVRWMGDVELCWQEIVLSGAAVAVGVGLVWLGLLRYFAGVFVWISILALLLCFAFLTVQFLIYGKVIDTEALTSFLDVFTTTDSTDAANDIIDNLNVFSTEAESQEKMYRILGYVMLGITSIYLLLVITMQRKIRLAVAVLREATKCVAAMPSILFFPLGTVVVSIGVTGYCVYVALLIASAGEIQLTEIAGMDVLNPNANATARLLDTTNTTEEAAQEALATLGDAIVGEFAAANTNTYLFIYNFFGFLWTVQLVGAVGATTIAGSVSAWYWASPSPAERRGKLGRTPVFSSLKRTLRFHLGSLAFGSFIIAVVQLIRALLAYLDKQTQSLQKKNRLVKIIMKTVQCCLWCFEKILKYITKNAYIMIAIHGSSFCTATRDGFLMLIKNLASIGVATAINNLLLLIAKLVIACSSGAVCWLLVTNKADDEDAPSSAIVPVLVAATLAWYVGANFMAVYALAVDTIMICFCEDRARNDGSAHKPFYMSKALQKIASRSNKMYENEKKAQEAAADDDLDDNDDGSKNDSSQGKGAAKVVKGPSEAPML